MSKHENFVMSRISLRATIKGSNIVVTVIRKNDGAIQQEVIPCEFIANSTAEPEVEENE